MSYSRVANRPIKLHWAGWESDTYRLGQAGWEMSVYENVPAEVIAIAIRHPRAGIEGISHLERYEYFTNHRPSEHGYAEVPAQLKFEAIGREIHIPGLRSPEEMYFKPLDHRPTLVEFKTNTIQDYAHFASLENAQNRVYLQEASIQQILEMALEKQQPNQVRIRENLMREQRLREMRTGSLHTELRLVA